MKLNRPPGPRLGELLEKRGRISRDVLLNALRHQRTNGGRIGTCLLELEAIGENDLLDVLSDQLKVPFTPPEELRSLPEDVIKLVPEKVARQRFSVPLRASSTHVTVAMRDPADLLALDEVAFVTGRRIRVQVTSEMRILEALAKYYGVELAGRFTKLLDKLNRERFLWSQAPPEAPPPAFAEPPPLILPQRRIDPRSLESGELRAVPAVSSAATASTSGSLLKPIVSVYDSPAAPPAPAPTASVPMVTMPVEVIAPPVAPPIASPAPPRPEPSPVAPPPVTPAPVAPAPVAVAPVAAAPAPGARVVSPPPLAAPPPAPAPPSPPAALGAVAPATSALAEVEERLAASSGRDEIGQILIEFARPRAAAALLLMVRRDEAAGWLGFGPGLDDESVESCRVDLSAPSFVRTLRDGAAMHRGALAPLPAHAEIRAMLSTNWATDLLALPLRMRERLVGVLVMTLEEGEFAPATVDELTRLTTRASVALELVVLRQKLQTP